MEFEFSESGPVAKLSLHGRLDTAGVDLAEPRLLASILPAARNTIVDLADVSFISSMGVRMLIGATHALRRKEAALVLYGASPQVAESLRLVIEKIIPLVATESEALALAHSAGKSDR